MPASAGSWRRSKKAGGVLLITADHGNAEQMYDETTHQKHTQHTLNRVPALLFNAPASIHSLADGKLADVAPTMLALMGVPQPREMTGHSLLSEASRPARPGRAARRRPQLPRELVKAL